MSSITVIIDGNNIGFAEHSATKLKSGDLPTQAIFGFIRRIRELRMQFSECNIIVLWDSRAEWRFKLWPSYKSNREADPKMKKEREEYKRQRPYIERVLATLGVRQITVDGYEADDMAGYFVRQLMAQHPDNRIVLYTNDKDWLQLVRKNVFVLSPKKEGSSVAVVTERNFLDATGYISPIAFLEGKALQGDSSDVIPGVGGIGKDSAPEFIATHGSVSEFFRKVDCGEYTPQTRKSKDAKSPHPEERLASKEGRAAFLRNLKLMQLLRVAKPDPSSVRVIHGKADKEKFAEFCEELAFFSYLNDLDNFFKPFESK